jgi:hypothetical protein
MNLRAYARPYRLTQPARNSKRWILPAAVMAIDRRYYEDERPRPTRQCCPMRQNVRSIQCNGHGYRLERNH